MNEESFYPPDWIKIAQKDWHRVSTMLNDGDAEAAGYFLQQSLEKYLKAFLLQRGWKLKKIHLLHTLLDEAVEHDSKLEAFRDLCERVSGYYISDRYPYLVTSELTCDEVKKDLEEAAQFISAMGFNQLEK